MRLLIKCAILVIICLISGLYLPFGPDSASARSFAGPEYVALHIAEAYWGGRPPLCHPLIKRVVPERTFLREVQAENGVLQPGEIITGSADQPRYEIMACGLYILENMEWPELCITMVHEVGHLWGLPHSHDPSSPMYPTAAADTVPSCASGIDPGPPPF